MKIRRSCFYADLYEQVVPTLAEALEHAQEQMRRLHQVTQERTWLHPLVKLAQESEEDFTEFHQVEHVTYEKKYK